MNIKSFSTYVSILFLACVFQCAASLVPKNVYYSSDFQFESHPNDENIINTQGTEVNSIKNGSWISFQNFNVGTNTTHLYIEAASILSSGRSIQIRLGSETGSVIGRMDIPITGGINNFQALEIALDQTLSGNQNLFFTFTGPGSGDLFDIRGFWFSPVSPNLKQLNSVVRASNFDIESHDNASPIVINANRIEAIQHNSWIAFRGFNFGTGANYIELEAATPGRGGRVEILLDSPNGNRVGVVDVGHTGSWTFNRIYSATLNQTVSGIRDVYLRFLDLDSIAGATELFRLNRFSLSTNLTPAAPTQEGRLSIYPHVPATNSTTVLDQSPYYRISVQKKRLLNHSNQALATNWLSPFAWFTECVPYEKYLLEQEKYSAYYSEYIGSWSHTYSNFELDRNTPIVVKITRLDSVGAPSGDIITATAHPAHRVLSCEVIGGDVYVTMSEPALISIDIDGQMSNRDTPRNIPSGGWTGAAFPHRNKMDGVHAVSIFANAFIDDKPNPAAPGVRTVTPGQLPDLTGTWDTLYFLPGIHKLAANPDGSERSWQVSDIIPLLSGKKYYIPGDAIVYGNMSDFQNNSPDNNIRVYGHGTLSGEKTPHFRDFPPGTTPSNQIPAVGSSGYRDYMTMDGAFLHPSLNSRLEMMSLTGAENCHYEGITVADPSEHGIQMIGGEQLQNTVRWVKNISWRTNNDGASIGGNTLFEDSFLRHQDDAMYMSGQTARRIVFWSDVNGIPLRCSFITRERDSSYPSYFPPDEIVEDCDVIFARGVFLGDTSTSAGIIAAEVLSSANGLVPGNRQYSDGTFNTAQHLVIRNLRVTDPRPQRALISLKGDTFNVDGFKGWAGIRLENINMTHANTWTLRNPPSSRPNRILAASHGPARLWTFSNVSIAGQTVTQQALDTPNLFQTEHVSEMVFKNTTYSLTRSPSTSGNITTGTISASPHSNQYASNTPVQVLAVPAPGYVFSSWNGALAGSTSNPAVIVMDTDKTVTANFIPTPSSLTKTPVFQVNSGGPSFTSGEGLIYAVDSNFSGGGVNAPSTPSAIDGTLDDKLYQSERFGSLFSYNIPLEAGSYEVTLKFAEIHFSAANRRVFNVALEGSPVITALDLWQKVGKNKAYDETYSVTVTDGTLNISFTSIVNNAKISAIHVVKITNPIPRTLTTTAGVGGSITPVSGSIHPNGSVITVNAIAANGYRFSNWGGDLSGTSASQALMMDNDKSVSASFVRQYSLLTNHGAGGNVNIVSGTQYDEGTQVSLVATATPGFRFLSWSGSSVSTNPTITILMDGTKSLTASFLPIYSLTTNATTGGSVTPASGLNYDEGTLVNVTATPSTGYRFLNWSGASTSTSPTLSILMNEAKTLTAHFIQTEALWTGASNSNWDTASNWTLASIPTNGLALNFGGIPTSQPTNLNFSGLTTGFIQFTNNTPISTNPLVSGFTLGAGDLSQSITLGGNITATAPANGSISFEDIINLNLILNADRTISTSRNSGAAINHNLRVNGMISGAFQLTKGATGGDLFLTHPANSFSGPIQIQGGNCIASFLDISGRNSSIGSGNGINLDNGQLHFNGSVAPSSPINRTINLSSTGNAGGGISNSGSVSISFNGSFQNTNSSGNKNFALGGNNTGSNLFANALVNSPAGQNLSFTKSESGQWTLSGENTYTGQTQINNGTLNISSIADSGTSNIGYFQGNASTGGLRIGNGNSTGTLSILSTGNAGTTNRTLQIGNGTGNGSARITNNSLQSPLIFNAPNFNLPTETTLNRTLFVAGSNADGNQITGIIRDNTGAGGTISITKEGIGRWIFAGENSYSGNTLASAGVLQLNHTSALPTASPLTINGGVIGLGAANFTRALGSNPGLNQVAITGSNSGFAAYGSNRSVNLGGNHATLTWTVGGFFNSGQNTMILSHRTATHALIFENPINLNSVNRTFQVDDGAASEDAIISGAITNSSGSAGVNKTGSGTLVLTGTNSYTGTTQVSSGTLALVNGSHTSPIVLNTGSSLRFTLGSPSSSSASIDLTLGTIKIEGIPTTNSHLLMSASSITGTPTLDAPIPGYELVKNNANTQLLLRAIPSADPFVTWAGTGLNFEADANQDGIVNGLAWVLGAPNAMSQVTLPTVSNNGTDMTLTFQVLNSQNRSTAQIFIQHSGDVGLTDSWTDSIAVPDIAGASIDSNGVHFHVVLGNPLNTITATISQSQAINNRLFARVRVVR